MQQAALDSTVDQKAFDTFWHFINERNAIWERRNEGLEQPWTNDEILQKYRFCNVFRELDRGSKFAIDEILKWQDNSSPERDGYVLYNLFLYRGFNLPETYRYLRGEASLVAHDEAKLIGKLERLIESGVGLYNSAYILRGFEGQPKHVSIVQSLGKVWEARDSLAASIVAGGTLQNTVSVLLGAHIRGWGEFTCYQVALDLTYCGMLDKAPDINTWCIFGVGAQEGLRRLWPDITLREEQMLEAGSYLLTQSQKYAPNLMRPLNLQDIEFALCELAKYMKIQEKGWGRRIFTARSS